MGALLLLRLGISMAVHGSPPLEFQEALIADEACQDGHSPIVNSIGSRSIQDILLDRTETVLLCCYNLPCSQLFCRIFATRFELRLNQWM